MSFIKVTMKEGEVHLNSAKIEMIIPKPEGCTIRISERLFLQVKETAKEVADMLNN